MNNEKKKLLIVEDDPGLQKQLRWCFENYDVIIAEDRASAFEKGVWNRRTANRNEAILGSRA